MALVKMCEIIYKTVINVLYDLNAFTMYKQNI